MPHRQNNKLQWLSRVRSCLRRVHHLPFSAWIPFPAWAIFQRTCPIHYQMYDISHDNPHIIKSSMIKANIVLKFQMVQAKALIVIKKNCLVSKGNAKPKFNRSWKEFHSCKKVWQLSNQNITCLALGHKRNKWSTYSLSKQKWQVWLPSQPLVAKLSLVKILFLLNYVKTLIFRGTLRVHYSIVCKSW